VNSLYCLEEWRGEQRISPPGNKIHPWGTTSPLGSKFASRDEVKNEPQSDFIFCHYLQREVHVHMYVYTYVIVMYGLRSHKRVNYISKGGNLRILLLLNAGS
jgi:hypothetical protein